MFGYLWKLKIVYVGKLSWTGVDKKYCQKYFTFRVTPASAMCYVNVSFLSLLFMYWVSLLLYVSLVLGLCAPHQ